MQRAEVLTWRRRLLFWAGPWDPKNIMMNRTMETDRLQSENNFRDPEQVYTLACVV